MASTRFTSLLYTLPVILTTSLAAAQNGDGGAASGNLPPSAAGGDAAGAAGPSSGSFTLSTGATVAIAVVVSIVVVLGSKLPIYINACQGQGYADYDPVQLRPQSSFTLRRNVNGT